MTLTYEQMLERVISCLSGDGAADDSREAAVELLKAIGITQPTIQTVALTTPLKHPMMPMPCCERKETRGPNCFRPMVYSDEHQTLIEADAERKV